MYVKIFPQITFAGSRFGTWICRFDGPHSMLYTFSFFLGSLNNPMHLRDAKPQVLFLESRPDCNLVCLIPSTHISILQSLPSGRQPCAVWLGALAALPTFQRPWSWLGLPSPKISSATGRLGHGHPEIWMVRLWQFWLIVAEKRGEVPPKG